MKACRGAYAAVVEYSMSRRQTALLPGEWNETARV